MIIHKTKERDLVFDALKFFAIFLVLWGHSIQHLLSTDEHQDPVYLFIYSFHMPLFMTLVGYFSGSALKMSFRQMLANKGRRLLLPALTIGICYLVVGFVAGDIRQGVVDYVDRLWFLKSAFLCFVVYCLAVKLFRRKWIGIGLSLAFSLMFSRYSFTLMYPCFLLGVLLRRYIFWFKSNSGKISLFSGIIFVAMMFFWDGSYWDIPSKSEILSSLPSMELLSLWASRLSFRIVLGFAGTVFFISLFEFLAPRVPSTSIGRRMCSWGADTLGIYIFQTVILEILLPRWVDMSGFGLAMFDFVIAPAISLATLLLCLWIIRVTKRSGWLSFLLLGEKLPRRSSAETDL